MTAPNFGSLPQKNILKKKLSVLLAASVERFSVSRMRDLSNGNYIGIYLKNSFGISFGLFEGPKIDDDDDDCPTAKCLYSVWLLRSGSCAETLSHSTIRHVYNILYSFIISIYSSALPNVRHSKIRLFWAVKNLVLKC